MARLTIDDLLEQAREGLQRVTPEQAHEAMLTGATVIDIRAESQIAAVGTVPGALVIARNVLEWRIDPASDAYRPDAPGFQDPVIVMCDAGWASSLAAQTLQSLGFEAGGSPVMPPAG